MELRTVTILFVTLLVLLGEDEVDGWRRRRRRRWVPPPPQSCTVSGRNMFFSLLFRNDFMSNSNLLWYEVDSRGEESVYNCFVLLRVVSAFRA